jgi:hypothetical protein
MELIITQQGRPAHESPDAAARRRYERLAKATVDQMQAALSFLSVIDPEAFEIALTAVTPLSEYRPDDEEAVAACRACGALVGIFPEQSLGWQHFRGNAATSGAQETYDPGHAPKVIWCLPDENPAEL